jgi:hypothetical protein
MAMVAALIPLAALASTPKTYSDGITGAEYYATSTDGKFAGAATGDLPGTWLADVQHAPLASTTVNITGGTLDVYTVVKGHGAKVVGNFADTGTITPTSGFGSCGTQTFSVTGPLNDVGVSGQPDIGSGIFQVTLTHYQFSLFGTCITYAASVTGSVTLTF